MSDIKKNKVTSLEIIVRMRGNHPYYEIKYKKLGENWFSIGYSSFDIKNVLKWKDECFEIVEKKDTNADRIRNMSDEELAEFFVKYDLSLEDKETEPNNWLEWLRSKAE